MNAPLHFWPTPRWAAEALVERYFGDLTMLDRVVEPSCGDGRFLQAIPDHVPAIGVEIDPGTAAAARANTGREVIVGDFLEARIPGRATAVIGNPPFQYRTILGFLDRAHALLRADGRVGFLLPAYFFQTAERVDQLARRWSIAQDMLPRNLYPRLRLPLCFAVFRKGRGRSLVGFALYREAAAVHSMRRQYRTALGRPAHSVWTVVVIAAIEQLGGEATLAQLYAEIQPRRPTGNRWWREKVRQVVQTHCRRTAPGRWARGAA